MAQVLLTKDRFSQLMPNTAKYFDKGMVCKQTYSSGEWTYPSIAGFMSGLTTSHHMMFHNEIDWKLPETSKTLLEYFHEEGYYTSVFLGIGELFHLTVMQEDATDLFINYSMPVFLLKNGWQCNQ